MLSDITGTVVLNTSGGGQENLETNLENDTNFGVSEKVIGQVRINSGNLY